MAWRVGALDRFGGTGEEWRGTAAALSGVQLLAVSFAGLIVLCAVGLLVLPGLYTGARLGVVDALFTATSAVCVTGLIVVDTATYFTTWGQLWILVFVQLGGLGILTFTTLIFAAAGRRASVSVEQAAGADAAAMLGMRPRTLVRAVVALTFTVEVLGAAALWAVWAGRLGAEGAVWPAIFHAVSAFCNAGFSIFSDSLVQFQRGWPTLTVMAALIVVGGLGFIALADLRTRFVTRTARRLALHTKLVLAVSALLLALGTAAYVAFEWRNVLATLPWWDRLTNAFFMSVTARTAGFNTVDYDAAANPSVFLTVMLMFIGGSPGSTAGGLKTTTLALLLLLFWSRLRGRHDVSAFGRTVPPDIVGRAAGVAVGGIAVLGLAVLLLLFTELRTLTTDRTQFLRLAFEAHSAFGTVGLSMGATPGLSAAGKLVVTVLMFVGRIGPLTAAAAMAFAGGRRRTHYRYAHEEVMLG